MSTIQRVLFPINFSNGCRTLVPTLRKMIETWQAEVTLLHVVEERRWSARKLEVGRLMTQLQRVAADELHAPYVRCRLERGEPAGRILEYVQSNPVDLVVMSAGGSSRLHLSPIGEVTDRVLDEVPCPVWLDWGSARSSDASGMSARRICCALELNESDEPVFRDAATLAADLGADLTAVHAIFPAPGKPLDVLWNQQVREREIAVAKRRIEALRRRFHASAMAAIGVGSSHTVISRTIQLQQAGLLVAGNSRESILAAESECPVLRLPTAYAASAALRTCSMAAGASA